MSFRLFKFASWLHPEGWRNFFGVSAEAPGGKVPRFMGCPAETLKRGTALRFRRKTRDGEEDPSRWLLSDESAG